MPADCGEISGFPEPDPLHLSVLPDSRLPAGQQFYINASEHEPDTPYALFSDEGQINLDTVNDIISNPHFRNLETARGIFEFDYDKNYLLYNFRSGGKYCGRWLWRPRMPTAADGAAPSGKAGGMHRNASPAVRLLPVHLLRPDVSALFSLRQPVRKGSPSPGHQPAGQNTGWAEEHSYLMVLFLPEHRLKRDLYPPYLISQVEERWRGACAVEHQETWPCF